MVRKPAFSGASRLSDVERALGKDELPVGHVAAEGVGEFSGTVDWGLVYGYR